MLKNDFINFATNIGLDNKEEREKLSEKFEIIQKEVGCAHGLQDSYYMADYILRYQDCPGPIVEFGCYQGGMSCKLSLVAELLNKKYIIFDSFEGLPEDATYKTYEENLHFLGEFKKNMYACSVEQVKNNLQKYGSLLICEFHAGSIEETLLKTNIHPCHVFIDVDLFPTAKFIIKNIWSKITSPALFTHEACLSEYMDAILNKDFWQFKLGANTPALGHTVQNSPYGLTGAMCLDCLIKDKIEFENYSKILEQLKFC